MRLGSSSDHWQQVKSCFREKRLIFVAEKMDSANATPIVEDSQARLARLERLEKLGNTIPSPKPKPHEDYESMSNEQRLAILKNAVPKNSEAFAKKATPITRPKDEDRRTAITKNQEEEKSKKETSGQAENTTALHYVHGIDAYTTIAQYDAKIALEKGFSVEDWFDQDGNLAVKLVENKGFATFLQSTIAPNTDRNIEDVQTAITEIIRGTDSGKNILQQLQIAILQAPQKGKEAVYSNFYGFKIEDAVTSYIGARGKFSDAGIAASSWFDKDGKLIADKTQLQKLLPPILAFVPGGKYQNAEAFLQAINAENTDALRALQILQETIATRESMISKQMEVMSEAKKSDPNASFTTIIDNYSENYMDLFRYGTSYEKGLAAAGIAAGIYGIVKSKWVRYAVGSTIGLQLVEKVTGFNLLKKAGVLKDNMVIKGTASDAMYGNIKEQYSKKNSRNDLDSLEQKALDYDDEKTAAIIKLNNTPLKDLLNWHQAYYSAPDDTERKNVLKQCPRQARFMVNSMSPEETAGLTMGVLSLYLKQSARNSAKTDPQVANRAIDSNFARKLVRAKYFGEQEDGNQIFTGVSDRYAHMEFRQKDKSATLDFNDFVDREVSTADLARNFEEPHTVVDQVASAIITWGETNLTLENVKQFANNAHTNVDEIKKYFQQLNKEFGEKAPEKFKKTKEFFEKHGEKGWELVKDGIGAVKKYEINGAPIGFYIDDPSNDFSLLRITSGVGNIIWEFTKFPIVQTANMVALVAEFGNSGKLEEFAQYPEIYVRYLLSDTIPEGEFDEAAIKSGAPDIWWSSEMMGQFADEIADEFEEPNIKDTDVDGSYFEEHGAFFIIGKSPKQIPPDAVQKDPLLAENTMKQNFYWTQQATENAIKQLKANQSVADSLPPDWEKNIGKYLISPFYYREGNKHHVAMAYRVPTLQQTIKEGGESADTLKSFESYVKTELEKFLDQNNRKIELEKKQFQIDSFLKSFSNYFTEMAGFRFFDKYFDGLTAMHQSVDQVIIGSIVKQTDKIERFKNSSELEKDFDKIYKAIIDTPNFDE